MTEITNAYDWNGRTVIGSDGEKIGKVDELYLDRESDQPEWARVHTGFGHQAFVRAAGGG
jgi:sporulation protein YlmC with PRC-barrel domain